MGAQIWSYGSGCPPGRPEPSVKVPQSCSNSRCSHVRGVHAKLLGEFVQGRCLFIWDPLFLAPTTAQSRRVRRHVDAPVHMSTSMFDIRRDVSGCCLIGTACSWTVTHGLKSTGQNNVWQSEWLHMLINVINHQGQKCHMIDGGGGFHGGRYDRD